MPAGLRPWSAYFYPLRDDVLFSGNDSPLAKYDALSKKRSSPPAVPSQAQKWEQASWQQYRRNSQSWEGRCHAWAFASVLAKEPKRPRTLNGVRFEVADQKALLLLTHEAVEIERYHGVNYEPGPDADGNDPWPDEFHRFLQAELYEGKRAFVMDSDPGVAIWNYPGDSGTSEIQADPSDPRRLHVRTLLIAKNSFDRSSAGSTSPDLFKAFEYTYDLVGNPRPDGSLDVVCGEWTGDSRKKQRPDYLIPMPQPVKRQSANPEINPALVDEILGG